MPSDLRANAAKTPPACFYSASIEGCIVNGVEKRNRREQPRGLRRCAAVDTIFQ
jgi:hypothetical protein